MTDSSRPNNKKELLQSVPKSVRFALASIIIGLIATGLSYSRFSNPEIWSDLYQPLCSARALVSGQEPYSVCAGIYRNNPSAPYPMTTFIAFAPFGLLNKELASALIWGIANGLLVFGLLYRGEPWWRWIIFASGAYWYAFRLAQFSILMTAIMLLPSLIPLTLLKPQLGLPIILTHLNKKRLLALSIFALISLIIYPTWPKAWYDQAKYFDGVIPLLVLPIGPLLLLALLHWRDPEARFLLMMACIPQRNIYDLTPLWLLPKSPRQMILLSALSWIVFASIRLAITPFPENTIWLLLACIYFPLLIMILRRSPEEIHQRLAFWRARLRLRSTK